MGDFITLSEALGDDLPEDDEMIWQFVSPDEWGEVRFKIVTIDPAEYVNADHGGESLLDMFKRSAKSWQKKLVQRYMRGAKSLSKNNYLVVDSDSKTVVDGQHRTIAFYRSGIKVAKAIDLAQSDDTEENPPEKVEWPWGHADLVYHVGWLDPAGKTSDSLEGAGLSVSVNPDEWVEIAQLGGRPRWKLTKQNSRFLNYHQLSKKQRETIAHWGVRNGYVERVKAYEVSWRDVKDADYWGDDDVRQRSIHETLRSAKDERLWAESEYIDVRMRVVNALKPTAKMARETKTNRDLLTAQSLLATIFSDRVLGFDGTWWDDDLNVQALSAPRGVISLSKLPEWKIDEVPGHG